MDIENDYVNFGDVCRNQLGMQCQRGYYLLEGFQGYPKMKDGLRITGNDWNYHSLKIHKDDIPKFKERIEAWEKRYE
jgi:hypothetical protein